MAEHRLQSPGSRAQATEHRIQSTGSSPRPEAALWCQTNLYMVRTHLSRWPHSHFSKLVMMLMLMMMMMMMVMVTMTMMTMTMVMILIDIQMTNNKQYKH